MELAVPKDKFNLSNDQFYEVSKDRSRIRQTFGQLIVEHAYPAQKLQLPFVSTFLVFLTIKLTVVSLIVQNAPVKERSSILPSSCTSIPS